MTELHAHACPRCLHALSWVDARAEFQCPCGYLAPRLGGVPILVPDPETWCARYREAATASLAEAGLFGPDSLDPLLAWAERARGVSPDRFSDDWVPSEVGASPPSVQDSSPPSAELSRWVQATRAAPLEARLASLVEGSGLEVGCGAATATPHLVARGSVTSGDVSLRAALRAQSHGATAVVFDAHALPFADGSFDWVLAANVVDLLDEPAAFLDGAKACLRPGGRLVLSTPDPALGGRHEVLVPLLDELGFGIVEVQDGVPWVRSHTARHLEIYLNQVVVAEAP